MKVAVGTGRARVETALDGLRIAIPARRNWFVILFLLAWLGGWAMGELSASRQLLSGKADPFLWFWLAGWTLGGAMAFSAWCWNVAGMETLAFRSGTLAHRIAVGPLGWTREYDLNHVRNLRAVPRVTSPYGRSGRNVFFPTDGTLAFDYGPKTLHVGSALDEAEARQLVDTITARFPLR